MKTEMLPLKSITPYIKNAKKHPKEQVEKLANSIKEFGFNQPLVVDKNKVIIVGHGRYEAAKLLELKEVPVIMADLSEDQAKAYRIADNRLNESQWELGLVKEDLQALADIGFDFTVTGFDLDFLSPLEDLDPEELPDKQIQSLHEVIVVCDSSETQQEVYESLTNQGYKVRLNSI